MNFDSDLSESRYCLGSSLFDQIITFRHKELVAATKAIHDAEKRLEANANARLDEARTAAQTRDKTLLALFKADKKDPAATVRRTKVEEQWAQKVKANYAKAAELASAAK